MLLRQDDALSRAGQHPTDTVRAPRAGQLVNTRTARPGRGRREGMRTAASRVGVTTADGIAGYMR